MSGESHGFIPQTQLPEQPERFNVIAYIQEQDGGNGLEDTQPMPAVEAGVDAPEPPVQPGYIDPGHMFQAFRAVRRVAPRPSHQPAIEVNDSALLSSTPLDTLTPASDTPIFNQLQADIRDKRPVAQVMSLQERGPLVMDQGSVFEGVNSWFQRERNTDYSEARRPAVAPAPRFEDIVAPVAPTPKRTLQITNQALPLKLVPVSEIEPEIVEQPVAAQEPSVDPAATKAFLERIQSQVVELEEHAEPSVETVPQLDINEGRISLRGIRASVVEYAVRHERVVQAAEYVGTVAAAAIVGAKLLGRLRRRR